LERLANTQEDKTDEGNLKIMNLTHFHPKSMENLGKITTAQSTSDLSPKHQTFLSKR